MLAAVDSKSEVCDATDCPMLSKLLPNLKRSDATTDAVDVADTVLGSDDAASLGAKTCAGTSCGTASVLVVATAAGAIDAVSVMVSTTGAACTLPHTMAVMRSHLEDIALESSTFVGKI